MSVFRVISFLLISALMLVEGHAQVFPVKENRKWGLVDREGRMVASPVYDAIHQVDGDHAVVVRDGKYGLINSRGTLLIETRYTFVKPLSDQLILLNEGGECEEGDCQGGKWGVIHLGTNALIAPRFDLVTGFDSAGYARVNVGGQCDYEDCRGGLWGLVDTLAVLRIPAAYQAVRVGNGTEAFVQSETGWGRFDLVGDSLAIQPIFGDLERIAANRLTMKVQDRYGVLRDNGSELIPARYEGILDAGEGYLAFRKGNLYGLMDSLGAELVTPRFEQVRMRPYGWCQTRLQGEWGLCNLRNEDIIAPSLRAVGVVGPDFAVVQRGPRWGMTDTLGNLAIPIRYEEMLTVDDSLFMVRERKYTKWLDKKGNILKSFVFQEMEPFQDRTSMVTLRDKRGIISDRGEWLVPPRFEQVYRFVYVGKGVAGGKSKMYYWDEEARPTTVPRLVIRKDEEEVEDLGVIGSATGAGWFYSNARQAWGLRSSQSNRILIQPLYSRVQLVPGSNLSIGMRPIRESETQGWALVDHRSGEELTEPIFSEIMFADLLRHGIMRVRFNGNGRYALLKPDGELVNFDQAAYIGDFQDGIARINLGGSLSWENEPGPDSLMREVRWDRDLRENVVRYLYCRGGHWSFVDTTGQLKVKPTFRMLRGFENGLAPVMGDSLWGLMNRDFKVVVPPQFDFIEPLYAGNGEVLYRAGMEIPQYGFIDSLGEITIRPAFGEVGSFRDGKVRIREGGLWGFADSTGQVVVAARYKEVSDYHEGRARVRDGRYWGYLDASGAALTKQEYLRAGDFHEGLAWVQRGKFFGYLNQAGELVIEPEYTRAWDFKDGMAMVERKSGLGMIDREGKWVVPPKYSQIGEFVDGLSIVKDDHGYGVIDPAGRTVVKPGYREIGDFSEGLARFREKLGYGYLDTSGVVRIPCAFPNAGDFHGGRARVFEAGRWGFIDTSGTQVIEARFSKVGDFSEERAAVRVGDLWGFIDPQGRMAVPMIYDRVGDFEDGRAPVFLRDKGWGFVNPDGTLLIPCQYDAVGRYQNGQVAVQQNGKWGLVNVFGAAVTMLKYDEIQPYAEGKAAVLLQKKVGVVTGSGKVLLPAEYDVIECIEDRIQIEAADEIGYMDPSGNWIWPMKK